MGDTHRDARFLSSAQRENRKGINVTVDYLPVFLPKESQQLSSISQDILIRRNLKDATSQ